MTTEQDQDRAKIHQDRTKIHGEINQIVNQRFLLASATVTVFVLIAKDLFPSFVNPDLNAVLKASEIALIYSVVLSFLYLQKRLSRSAGGGRTN